MNCISIAMQRVNVFYITILRALVFSCFSYNLEDVFTFSTAIMTWNNDFCNDYVTATEEGTGEC